jgi:hypothetical protein
MRKKLILALALLAGISASAQQAASAANPVPVYGTDNCGFGFGALNNTGTGVGNTATGVEALNKNASGEHNTANGEQALYRNENGNHNTASGWNALYNNACGTCSGGHNNTATGHSALYSNTSGSQNTATGKNALYTNSTGNNNTATGYGALFSNTAGGSAADDNTAMGYYSLYQNSSGDENTSSGKYALVANSIGIGNTAIGVETLGGGLGDTYIGFYNTAIGYRAAQILYTGNRNVGIGYEALGISQDNTGGGSSLNSDLVAIGYRALYNCKRGNNVAVGINALLGTTYGEKNTGVGGGALSANLSGGDDGNTAVGDVALSGATSNNNTAIGTQAFQYSAVQNNNTAAGADADFTGIGSYANSTVIGYQAQTNASNKVRLGNGGVSVIETTNAFSPPSDGRFKSNISESDVKGLAFVQKLRPVVYNFDTKKFTQFLNRHAPDSVSKKYLARDFSKSTASRQSGFIAQEVEQAAAEAGYDFSAIRKPSDGLGHYSEDVNYGLAYDEFVVPLVKAVQEQQVLIEAQAAMQEKLRLELIERNRLIEQLAASTGVATLPIPAHSPGISLEAKVNASGKATDISFSSQDPLRQAHVGVYELSGRQVVDFTIDGKTSGMVSLSHSAIASGSYFCCLLAGGNILATIPMNISGKQ